MEHDTITAELRRFSFSGGGDSVGAHCDRIRNFFDNSFEAKFYANGCSNDSGGYVSILFRAHSFFITSIWESVTLFCTASVIDASGNKRFPRSLSIHLRDFLNESDESTLHKHFGFEKFIERSHLLRDPSDLLPGDCLTLCLEFDLQIANDCSPLDADDENSGLRMEGDGSFSLRMETGFARTLCKMSGVFRDMVEFSKKDELFPIPPGDGGKHFHAIHQILDGYWFATPAEICELYKFADKYDLREIVETCRRFLIGATRARDPRPITEDDEEDYRAVSELAERFEDDECLSQILKMYSDFVTQPEVGNGKLYSEVFALKGEWGCRGTAGRNFFIFRKIQSESFNVDAYK